MTICKEAQVFIKKKRKKGISYKQLFIIPKGFNIYRNYIRKYDSEGFV